MYAGFLPNLMRVMSNSYRQMPLDAAQPVDVLQKVPTGDSVLYMDEFPMYFYFSHGGLGHRAVYYPAMRDLADERRWVAENVGMVVAMRTGDQYKVALNDPEVPSLRGGFPLRDDAVVRLRAGDGEIWRAAKIRLESTGSAALRVSAHPDDEAQRHSWNLPVPATEDGWVPLAVPAGTSSRTLEITPASGAGPILLSGIRAGNAATTDWPWDQGVSVAYQHAGDRAKRSPGDDNAMSTLAPASAQPGAERGIGVIPRAQTVIEFDSELLIPARCESRGVVDDRGAMVAIRARCGDA